MKFLKGIFTLIGALVVIGLIMLVVNYGSSLAKMDGKALGLYMKMADDVLTTGDPAKGMVIKRKLIIYDIIVIVISSSTKIALISSLLIKSLKDLLF